jgi:hypothetical protein
MSTSQRTLEQVKSILGKLDRRIDAVRAQRLGGPLPPQGPGPGLGAASGGAAGPAIGTSELRGKEPPASGYGRAQPLRLADRKSN